MTNEEILQLARKIAPTTGSPLLMWMGSEVIAFAHAIRNAALEEAADMVNMYFFGENESGESKLAANIREAKTK